MSNNTNKFLRNAGIFMLGLGTLIIAGFTVYYFTITKPVYESSVLQQNQEALDYQKSVDNQDRLDKKRSECEELAANKQEIAEKDAQEMEEGELFLLSNALDHKYYYNSESDTCFFQGETLTFTQGTDNFTRLYLVNLNTNERLLNYFSTDNPNFREDFWTAASVYIYE